MLISEETGKLLDEAINASSNTVKWTLIGMHPGSGDDPVFTFTIWELFGTRSASSAGETAEEAMVKACREFIETCKPTSQPVKGE